ncbi:hypothetical protein CCP3SC15_1440012 [Gammaproteobacteria bacterium]
MDFYKRKEMLRMDMQTYLKAMQKDPKLFKEFDDFIFRMVIKTGFGKKKILAEFETFGLRYDEEEGALVKVKK